jgi:hypothetical protein
MKKKKKGTNVVGFFMLSNEVERVDPLKKM